MSTRTKLRRTKRLFLKLGSCSRTLGFILNREFGHLRESHERALDPLAGGIIQQGYQCGMLWGASMAIGAEAYRRADSVDKAIALSIKATQHVMESFKERAIYIDCGDITDCDWTSKSSMAKYVVSGRVFSCFKLLEKWAPEAIDAAYEGLSHDQDDLPDKCISCASLVARGMGATDEEMVMVAGWAGGIGFSGDACGALGAAIWMKTLEKCKAEPGKSFFTNPEAKEIMEKFYLITDYEISCKEITGQDFGSLAEHTNFIEQGGCEKEIKVLSEC